MNIGPMKLSPLYVPRGKLGPSIGKYDLSLEKSRLPIGTVSYSVQGQNFTVSWRDISENRFAVAPDSVVEINYQLINGVLRHPTEEPSALLLNVSQISDHAWEVFRLAGDQFVSDIKTYCKWVVFLPQLQKNGREAFGFDLSMTGANDAQIRSFLAELTPDVQAIKSGLVFINPYYGSQGFFTGDASALTFEMKLLIESQKKVRSMRD